MSISVIALGGAGFVVLVLLWAVLTYNSMIGGRNRVDETWSGIDVQLKRRHDLIPNLVETVKGYASHEAGTLESVTAARNAAASASNPHDAGQAENMLTGALRQLFALSEAYPDLKADASFQELMRQLDDIEDTIQAARRIYNGNVRDFNTKIQKIPNNLVAGPFGFTAYEFFEVEDAAQRQTPSVSFT